MGTHRSYIWCHQKPTRPTGTRQGIHDAMSQWMCCGKWSALWTSYVILKRVPGHERKSISRNLFIFGLTLMGTFLLILGWGIPRKSLWHRFWNTLYTGWSKNAQSNLQKLNLHHNTRKKNVSCTWPSGLQVTASRRLLKCSKHPPWDSMQDVVHLNNDCLSRWKILGVIQINSNSLYFIVESPKCHWLI